MYSVLIVDDDVTTLEVMQSSVAWDKLQVSEVLTACNIKQAEDLLSAHPVDIVISDIEMPMGSGLELLDWYRSKFPDGEFLLLTCHDDFAYASEAIKYRASEYILKPFDAAVTEAALRKTIKRIEKNREDKKNILYGKILLESRAEIALAFWNAVLEGRYNENSAESRKVFSETLLSIKPDNKYKLAVCRITDYEEDMERFGRELLFFSLANICSELVLNSTEIDSVLTFENNSTLFIVIIIPDDESLYLQQKLRTLHVTYKRIFSGIMTCLTTQTAPIREMHAVFREAVKMLNANVAWHGEVFCREELADDRAHKDSHIDIRYLETLLETDDKRQILEYIKTHLEESVKNKSLSRDILNQTKQSILQAVYVDLAKHNISAAELVAEPGIRSLSQKASRSMLDFLRWLNQLLSLTAAAKEKRRREYSLSYRIENYIREHYSESLDRSTLAQEFHLSPEYLGKVYKKESGQKLNDFINSYRVEKAADLLVSTAELISDIAYSVGFESTSYFSTVFKKHTGLSPLEYRNEHSPETKD